MSWKLSYLRAGALVACIGVAAPAFAERVFTGESEFPRETEALVVATAALFDTVEAGHGAKPDADSLRLSPLPASVSAQSSLGDISAFVTRNGAVRHLTGYRITWYPVDTLYGAVDFMGTWADAKNLVCGYVTWDMSDPDAPAMADLVVNYVDVSEISDGSRADRETALLNANCAFGDVDSNYMAMN